MAENVAQTNSEKVDLPKMWDCLERAGIADKVRERLPPDCQAAAAVGHDRFEGQTPVLLLTRRSHQWPTWNRIFFEKLLSMDFCDVDDPKSQTLFTQIQQVRQWNGWGLNKLGFNKPVLGISADVGTSMALSHGDKKEEGEAPIAGRAVEFTHFL